MRKKLEDLGALDMLLNLSTNSSKADAGEDVVNASTAAIVRLARGADEKVKARVESAVERVGQSHPSPPAK